MREVEALDAEAMSAANLSRGQGMSFRAIDTAIEKMPGQAFLYTDHAAAMLIAYGGADDLARATRARALGINYAATPDPTPGDPNAATVAGEGAWNYRNQYVKSLGKVRAALPRTGEGVQRVEREICGQYRAQPTFRDKAGSSRSCRSRRTSSARRVAAAD